MTVIDKAQYKERTNNYDFDMAHYTRGMSLSPGNEQLLYWGAHGVTQPGTRNWMGMNSPAAEAMIDHMVNAADQDGFRAATRALDRVLTAGRYVIPFWAAGPSRIAHKKSHYPITSTNVWRLDRISAPDVINGPAGDLGSKPGPIG